MCLFRKMEFYKNLKRYGDFPHKINLKMSISEGVGNHSWYVSHLRSSNIFC